MRTARSQKQTESVLHLKVICTDFPGLKFCDPHANEPSVREPVYLGIQHGSEVIGQVPADRRRAIFNPEFRVSCNPDGTPNFLGPYAQGTVRDRFVYLSWGVKQRGARFVMFRRLKLRLGHLSWEQIDQSMASGQPVVVRLKLTDAHGCPLCATPPQTHIRWETGGLVQNHGRPVQSDPQGGRSPRRGSNKKEKEDEQQGNPNELCPAPLRGKERLSRLLVQIKPVTAD
jgi:hypothetical protein